MGITPDGGGGLYKSDSNEKGVSMVRFRQWWWRMVMAVGVAFLVSFLAHRSDANGGIAQMLDMAIYSISVSFLKLDDDIARTASFSLCFGTFPAICAVIVYHFLIGRAHRAAMRPAGASSTKGNTTES